LQYLPIGLFAAPGARGRAVWPSRLVTPCELQRRAATGQMAVAPRPVLPRAPGNPARRAGAITLSPEVSRARNGKNRSPDSAGEGGDGTRAPGGGPVSGTGFPGPGSARGGPSGRCPASGEGSTATWPLRPPPHSRTGPPP